MTDNEIIARWAGFPETERYGWYTIGKMLLPPCYDSDIRLWHGLHGGETGLLKLIEERGIRTQFVNQWMKLNDWRGLGTARGHVISGWNHGLSPGAIWAFRCASAAELSAALVAVLKEEHA